MNEQTQIKKGAKALIQTDFVTDNLRVFNQINNNNEYSAHLPATDKCTYRRC